MKMYKDIKMTKIIFKRQPNRIQTYVHIRTLVHMMIIFFLQTELKEFCSNMPKIVDPTEKC